MMEPRSPNPQTFKERRGWRWKMKIITEGHSPITRDALLMYTGYVEGARVQDPTISLRHHHNHSFFFSLLSIQQGRVSQSCQVSKWILLPHSINNTQYNHHPQCSIFTFPSSSSSSSSMLVSRYNQST